MARLLIVDDEAPIRMLIRKYAEYEGHPADEAADGMEAVHLARGGTPRPAAFYYGRCTPHRACAVDA